MPDRKISINRVVLIYLMLIGFVSIATLGGLWFSSVISQFDQEADLLRASYMEEQKSILKREVTRAVDFVNYMQSRTENRLRDMVKNRVFEAYAIAWHIYEKDKDNKGVSQIEAEILNALRPIRFNNGKGYFFAFTLDGIEILFPISPELEGTSMLHVQGGHGELVVPDVLGLVARQGEGFYEYTWPKPGHKGFFPKIAFVKLFEPLNWVIGTGEYLDDVEKDIQAECLQWISSIHFDNDSYVFVGRWDGLSLSGPAVGQNMYEVTDANGVKIVQELIKAAKQGGGFVQYVLPGFESRKQAPKLSYAVGVPEWQWYIGAGVYVDEIESALALRKKNLYQHIRTHVRNVMFVLAAVMIVVAILIKLLSDRLRNNLSLFMGFFNRASTEATRIESRDLHFDEFAQLAAAANDMVDKRRQAESALRENEDKYRSLFHLSNEGIMLIKDVIIDCNEAACHILKCDKSEIIGKNPAEFAVPSTPGGKEVFEAQSRIWEAAYAGEPQIFQQPCYRKDGSIAELEISLKTVTVGGNRCLLAAARDMTEIKQVQRRIAESEERLRVIIESSPDAFFVQNMEGRIIQVNEAACESLGYKRKELIGMPILDIQQNISIDEAQELWKTIAQGTVHSFEGVHKRKDGSTFPMAMTVASAQYHGETLLFGFAKDTTEQKQLEKERQRYQSQIVHAQKMEAIGTLAGGIAHDFNNLLMSVQGHASLMAYELEDGHPSNENVKAIMEATRSAAALTKQLLGMARGGKYEVKPMDINKVVDASATLFGRTKKEIRIHTKFCDPPPVAAADQRQIEQVLLNMYINAWQAMPQGGELYLETAVIDLDEDFCRPHSVEPGPYVKVSITDTGIGMDKTIQDRIFDPFFTTKDKTRGTGLGLASAYGIIKNHAGAITVYSEVGSGTRFNIYLPITEEAVKHSRPAGKKPVETGSGTILLVDDEAMVTNVGKTMLKRLGYEVIIAKNGRETIDILTRQGEDIDLIILDMIMPGMSGAETFDHIRQTLPDMPVLLSSGYSMNGQAAAIMAKGCNGFLQKPFSLPELSQYIHAILRPTTK